MGRNPATAKNVQLPSKGKSLITDGLWTKLLNRWIDEDCSCLITSKILMIKWDKSINKAPTPTRKNEKFEEGMGGIGMPA